MSSAREHVEWFRQPENHGIRLDKLGKWHYRDAMVEADVVQQLFHHGLKVSDDGRYRLQVGPQWCWIVPEDTAFFVRGLEFICEGCGGKPVRDRDGNLVVEEVRMRLNDGTTEALAPETLAVSVDDVLYCRVKRTEKQPEGHRARFDRVRQLHLLEALLVETDDGGFGVRIGGVVTPIAAV